MRQFCAAVAVAVCATSAVADSNTATAQHLLNQLGLAAGPVDGSWGPRTGRAIDRFYAELGAVYDGSLDAQDISELEAAAATYRHFGNRDWSPEIRSDLHDIDISTAPFDYISDNLIASLVPFQQFSEPDLGMHPVGEPPDVEWVRRPMDVDCLTVLRDMSPPDMSRWDAPLYAQNCNYHYRQKIFGGGIDAFQEILDHWAAQPLGIYDLEPNGDDFYFKATLMAQVGTTYALFYDLFNNHAAIDSFITDWMLNNQTFVGEGTCPFSAPESFTPDRGYVVGSCGSNHWRSSVVNVALGLRLGDRQLFIAGVKHLEINLSMYDVDGIFTPYATRGWDSPGYAVDNNEYITSIALMLAEVDVNLYDLKIHDGRDIGALIEGHNAWLTDPSLAERYFIGSDTCNGGSCTRLDSMAALGPLDQWKVDRQFEDFDILLRSFHYQVTEKELDPIDLARMYPSDRGGSLPGMYVWGQTSAFPYIYATLERLDALEGYLEPESAVLDVSDVPLDMTNMECGFEMRRKLSGESQDIGIASGSIVASDGRVTISMIDIRTGKTPDVEMVMEEADLYLAQNGRIIGDFPVYTMHGNDRIDVVRFGSDFDPLLAGVGPQGNHHFNIDDSIHISLVITECE
jgi:hypothetical protein